MRLKSIKLAGFKSFVDPTTVNFPSNMAAVVGPNGCGKSNIIDAVRWVMGESSAKNLRGESMTDVIFNGSDTRKPVAPGLHRAGLRQLRRPPRRRVRRIRAKSPSAARSPATPRSTYFLNGTNCRRRDITDIFLGTGLGPRSYSIIEQGMISQLIEAKPEELRIFLEEAAGISKYKERRRETENRIRRTHENLERLTDLREELERQLDHLQRQAQAAEKYKEYKAEERQLKAQLPPCAGVRWTSRRGQRESDHRRSGSGLRGAGGRQRNADASIERLRDGHHELSERFNQVQGRFYSVGGDIARVEQSIQHGQQRLRQLQDDLREAERQRQETEVAPGPRPHAARHAWAKSWPCSSPSRKALRRRRRGRRRRWKKPKPACTPGRNSGMPSASAAPSRAVRPRCSSRAFVQLEQSLERLAERERRLRDEHALLAADPEDAAILELDEQLAEQRTATGRTAPGRAAALGEGLDRLRSELQQAVQAQQQAQGELQRLNGRLASLEALQQAALDPGKGAAEWLREQRLEQRPRLADGLRVEAGWELAVETVLGADLQAVLLDDFAGLDLARLRAGRIAPADAHRGAARLSGSLLDRSSRAPIWRPGWARCVRSSRWTRRWPGAASWATGESLISRDGYWVGRHFLRVRRAGEADSGVLARGQELERLHAEREAREATLEALEAAPAAAARQPARAGRTTRAGAPPPAGRGPPPRRAEGAVVRPAGQGRTVGPASSASRRGTERSRRAAGAGTGATRRSAPASAGRAGAMEQDSAQRETLLAGRDQLREAVERSRQEARQHKDQAHQLAVRIGSLKAQHDSTRQALERLELQFERAMERREQLSLNLEEGAAPLEELRMKLEELLERRMGVEEELKRRPPGPGRRRPRVARCRKAPHPGRAAGPVAAWPAGAAAPRLADPQRADARRCRTSCWRMATTCTACWPACRAMHRNASGRSNWSSWPARIQRLGAINLAAIDEYQQQSERKRYLDAQDADLVEALETLENVIRKIDKETRNRFKETFDQINAGLQALFPKVFGGGNAYLELTGEDLLDTGVAIMARPPGKKNSTIHLLSGGEKALTALALVFAIFQLNPAPFCMLDEVDAPLDDANVGRYARLVKEMSEKVQFIYITHNKIAMEMADQLMGVTMHEPGCSRLVAVDVEEAVALAEA